MIWLNFAIPRTMPSASGKAPPESEGPAPRGTTASGVGSRIGATRRVSAAPGSALARLEPRIDLVDQIDAPAAPHDAAVLVALLQRLQRIDDLHVPIPRKRRNIGSRRRRVNP